jgi:hypothetical protein
MLVGYTPLGGDAKQKRDDGDDVPHVPANKRCGSSTQAQAWAIQSKFEQLPRAKSRMRPYSHGTVLLRSGAYGFRWCAGASALLGGFLPSVVP